MESVRKAIGQRIGPRVVERGAWPSGILTKRYSSTRAQGRGCSGLVARWPETATIRQLQIGPAPLHKAQCQLAPERHNVKAPGNVLVRAASSGPRQTQTDASSSSGAAIRFGQARRIWLEIILDQAGPTQCNNKVGLSLVTSASIKNSHSARDAKGADNRARPDNSPART